MREKLEKIPIAVSGIMLAFATLGFLLREDGGVIYHGCCIISAVLFFVLLLRVIVCRDTVVREMRIPVKCSGMATFSMGMILLCDYARPLLGKADVIVWIVAVTLHMVLLVYFVKEYVLHLEIKKVYASYFIFFAGLSTIADTAPIFHMRHVGIWFSRASMILVVIMFFVITYRYLRFSEIEDEYKSLIGVYTSPTNLLIVGYFACDPNPNILLVTILAYISIMLYLFATFMGLQQMFGRFYPAFSSFTFPFVVTALAMKKVSEYASGLSGVHYLGWTNYVHPVQTAFAVFLMLYISMRFIVDYRKN